MFRYGNAFEGVKRRGGEKGNWDSTKRTIKGIVETKGEIKIQIERQRSSPQQVNVKWFSESSLEKNFTLQLYFW